MHQLYYEFTLFPGGYIRLIREYYDKKPRRSKLVHCMLDAVNKIKIFQFLWWKRFTLVNCSFVNHPVTV